jgi:VanZ family protein
MNQVYGSRISPQWTRSKRLHVVMYAMLLVATPFILLRNYLVEAISYFSNSSVHLFGIEFKAVPFAALLIFLVGLYIFRAYLTKYLLGAIALIILLNGLAQQITDYYFGHHFYDLQQNWHYLAYALFSIFVYRDLSSRGQPTYRIILATYFMALGLSAFDEIFQKFMSSRVFDIGDIAKDVYGVYLGLILVFIGINHDQIFTKNWKSIRHRKLAGYYKHPFTLMVLLFILSFIFVAISSILTESDYWYIAAVLTIIAVLLVFAIIHLSQFKLPKYIMLSLLIILILVQGLFFIKYRHDNIVFSRYGLTVYKGIPIPFFDIMIYPDGMFRLVDKKHYFNRRDRSFLLQFKTDIIIVSSGVYGKGGKGFPDDQHTFVYNPKLKNGTQIIILKNREAAETFNRLKREGKKVLMIYHNTC